VTANRALIAGVFGACLTWPSVALAQPSQADAALAQTLFDQAVTLMDKGDYPTACPKLVESQRLDPGGGTLLNIGLCREKEGKLASAWLAYNDALSQSIKDARADREATARSRIAAIGDLLSKVTVLVPPGIAKLEGLELKLDETPLRPASWGVPTPIDKGEHTLVVRALGKLPFEAKLLVRADGDKTSVTVEPLADAPIVVPLQHDQPSTSPPASYRPVAYALGGAGLASALAGVVMGVLAINRRASSDTECPNNHCTQRGVELNDQAKGLAWASNITVGIGIAAIGTGVVLFLVSPKASPNRAWITPQGASLSF